MKTTKIILIALIISLGLNTFAQVAINNDGSAPDSSAILDLKSTSGGLLLPRMNTVQISGIANPAAGLLIFNTDSSDFYGYNGIKWVSVWNTSDTLADWYCGNQLTDSRDSKSYTTVQIGTQCWMAENLNIGTMINGSINQTQNSPTEIIEKYCYDDNTSNCDTYGGLYQWDEMMQYVSTEGTQGICPTGWHLPDDEEWKTMEMELGMSQSEADDTGWRGNDEGGKMKETGTTHWASPNTGATNTSGFTGLPGGDRKYVGGSFGELATSALFWLSSENGSTAWGRSLSNSYKQVYRLGFKQTYGFSVRCVRD